MRYFAELSYLGTYYFGWQRQPNQISVQEAIEIALATILQRSIPITGCGRTDTGVHAKQYFLHFDYEMELPVNFLFRINKMLAKDIAIHQIFPVAESVHARFDAYYRAYEYHLGFQKNPFRTETAYFFPYKQNLSIELAQQATALLLKYEDFFPFCKSNTDVKTMKCELKRCEWVVNANQKGMVLHIAANRFLRGMVRLIVGMSLNVGMRKVTLEEVKRAMDTQTRLRKSWSVPPQGLFLTDIRYQKFH